MEAESGTDWSYFRLPLSDLPENYPMCRIAPLAGLLLAMSTAASAADFSDLYEPHTFKSGDGELRYRMMRPAKVEAGKKYPLVIFFHGAGERGSDNEKQLVHGMKDFASDGNRAKYPAFVVAPQCPEGQQWVNVPWSDDRHTLPAQPSDSMRLSLALVDSLVKELPVDKSRIYVTGLSMGGFGTWDAIARRPDFFAAAAPICGGGDRATAKSLAKLPIWIFHGDSDTAVKTQRSRDMVAALKAAGGEPKYTEYPRTGHDSWSPTYRDPKFMEWLFAQQR
jgi:predicted peptidase